MIAPEGRSSSSCLLPKKSCCAAAGADPELSKFNHRQCKESARLTKQHEREQRRKRVASRLHRYQTTDTFINFTSSKHRPYVHTFADVARALGLACIEFKAACESMFDRFQDTASMLLEAIGEPPGLEELSYTQYIALGVTVLTLLLACFCVIGAFTLSPADEYMVAKVYESAVATGITSTEVVELGAQGANMSAAAAAQSATAVAAAHSAVIAATIGSAAGASTDYGSGLQKQQRARRARPNQRLSFKIRVILMFAVSATGGYVLNVVHPLRSALLMGI